MLVSYNWLSDNIYNPDVIILDTRPKFQYELAHIINSQLINIAEVIKLSQFGTNLVIDKDRINKLFGELGINNKKTVVVYGEHMDPTITRIVWTFLYSGHTNTHILNTNFSHLQKIGIQMTNKITNIKKTTFVANINNYLKIDANELKNKLGSLVLIDARTTQEYMFGHLPTSISFPFVDGIQMNLFKEKNILVKLFNEKNILHNKEIVCYCTHGHRASSVFFQLMIAGYKDLRLYDGSFVDWYGRGFLIE